MFSSLSNNSRQSAKRGLGGVVGAEAVSTTPPQNQKVAKNQ